jgi:hypothetical protein
VAVAKVVSTGKSATDADLQGSAGTSGDGDLRGWTLVDVPTGKHAHRYGDMGEDAVGLGR